MWRQHPGPTRGRVNAQAPFSRRDNTREILPFILAICFQSFKMPFFPIPLAGKLKLRSYNFNLVSLQQRQVSDISSCSLQRHYRKILRSRKRFPGKYFIRTIINL